MTYRLALHRIEYVYTCGGRGRVVEKGRCFVKAAVRWASR